MQMTAAMWIERPAQPQDPGLRRVLITLPVLLTGGTEMQTITLVKVLTAEGYEVVVCCFFEHVPGMAAAMELAGARLIMLDLPRHASLWRLFRLLHVLCRRERPDIVHVQYMAPGFIPVLAARTAGVPTVFATVHQPGRPYGRWPRVLLRSASRLCTAFFCISRSVEQSWFGSSSLSAPEGGAAGRHWTIYNAVDGELINALSEAAGRPAVRESLGIGPVPVIGCVGRLRGEKGQEVLLRAMPLVAAVVPAVALLLVGDGPDRPRLEKLADRLEISSRVIWLGSRQPEEVFRLYGIMDVVAVPSHYEGFGLAAAEAMAAGRPVVGARVDGLAEVVADGETGLLFSPGDWTGLADRLLELLLDPERARNMGERGRMRIRGEFSISRFRTAVKAAYCQVVAHDGKSGSEASGLDS